MKLSLTITMCLSKTFLIVEDETVQKDTFLEYYTDSLSIFYSSDANFNDYLISYECKKFNYVGHNNPIVCGVI